MSQSKTPSDELIVHLREWADVIADDGDHELATLPAKAAAELTRLSAEKAEVERELAAHRNDCPTFHEFWNKHAMGSKVLPSCFLCGHQRPREEWAIAHLELPDVYVCKSCAGAQAALLQAREDALEEAAKVCESRISRRPTAYGEQPYIVADFCAAYIRALKSARQAEPQEGEKG